MDIITPKGASEFELIINYYSGTESEGILRKERVSYVNSTRKSYRNVVIN